MWLDPEGGGGGGGALIIDMRGIFLLFTCDPGVLGCTVVIMHNGSGKMLQYKTSCGCGL